MKKQILRIKKVEKIIEKNKGWSTGLPKFDTVPNKNKKMWRD